MMFDAAIKVLQEALKTAVIDIPCPICQIESAIRVLEERQRWAPLIEAAGKIEAPGVLVQVMTDLTVILARDGRTIFVKWMRDVVLPLLDALPDPATEKDERIKDEKEKV